MRTFLALPLAEEPGARVGELVRRTLALPGVGERLLLARPEGLHLTLVFLGEITGAALERLSGELPARVRDLPAPALELAGTGAFPDARRARVLWVGVRERHGEGGLAALRDAVLGAVRAAGIELSAEREPYRPHVTVARARGGGFPVPAAFASADLGVPWMPGAVVLFESVPGRGGARHEPRAVAPFSGQQA